MISRRDAEEQRITKNEILCVLASLREKKYNIAWKAAPAYRQVGKKNGNSYTFRVSPSPWQNVLAYRQVGKKWKFYTMSLIIEGRGLSDGLSD